MTLRHQRQQLTGPRTIRRSLTALKKRGTFHGKGIREYMLAGQGLHFSAPFRGFHGILTGKPSYTFSDERARLDGMFESTASA